MTRPGIELRFPKPLVNTLPTKSELQALLGILVLLSNECIEHFYVLTLVTLSVIFLFSFG